jgi:hypothetical protein
MYYPKSQIQSNLYTNGGEFAYASTKSNYIGYYYTTSDGKAYTGKEPNAGGDDRLVLFTPVTNNIESSTIIPDATEVINSTINLTDDPFLDETPYGLVNDQSNYPKLKNFKNRKIPNYYITRPTNEDIKFGGYNRFFTKKRTTTLYFEISETDYNLLVNKDKIIAFDLYEGINIFWKFNDSIENKSQVSKIEKNYKWYGFINFFNDDFSGLNSPPPTYLYTQGNEFLLPNRTSYVGFYHFMSNGKAMTGKYHGEGSDISLIQISSNPIPQQLSPDIPTPPQVNQTPITTSSPSGGGGSSGGGGY